MLHERPAATTTPRRPGPPELGEVDRVEALLARPGQHGLHLARRTRACGRRRAAARASDRLRSSVEQLLEHDVLLGCRQQPQRRGVELRGRVAAHQAVGEGVERRADRGRQRAAEARGHPVAQLLGGLAAEGQRQHRRRARRRGARCGRRSPRPGSWSCRCRDRRAPAAVRPGGRRRAAGRRRARAVRDAWGRARRGGTTGRCVTVLPKHGPPTGSWWGLDPQHRPALPAVFRQTPGRRSVPVMSKTARCPTSS